MKKYIFIITSLLILAAVTQLAHACKPGKTAHEQTIIGETAATPLPTVPGIYKRTGYNDPHGFVNLILTADSLFVIAAFGTMEIGTWDAYKNYLILEPLDPLKHRYYLTGRYDPDIENIMLRFEGFTGIPSLYSFDNVDFEDSMHPVFNPWPDCEQDMYYTSFDPGEHRSLQLAVYDRDDSGETSALIYDFPLPEGLNDFTVRAIDPRYGHSPVIMVYRDGLYSLEYDIYERSAELDELDESEMRTLNEIAAMARGPREGLILEFLGEDPAVQLIQYTSNAVRTVTFDRENLFTAECPESEYFYFEFNDDYDPEYDPVVAVTK